MGGTGLFVGCPGKGIGSGLGRGDGSDVVGFLVGLAVGNAVGGSVVGLLDGHGVGSIIANGIKEDEKFYQGCS